jgi:osmoprotectant transport system ATP-binding protein
MSEPAIEFRETGYSVNGTRLTGPLNLVIERGETLVLLGESGSGKTTTLRLINRLLDPTEGEVVVEGQRTMDWNSVRLRRRIGYMIQEVGLLPHLSVADNVGVVPRLEKWDSHRRRDRIEELLRLVGLPPDEFRDRRPQELSGGQRQRVGVARALAADPPILLCDEAFGAVDAVTRADLQSEFKSLAEALSKTVVFVTHDVREALALASRIAVLDRGVVRFLGTVTEFRNDETPAVVALRELQ